MKLKTSHLSRLHMEISRAQEIASMMLEGYTDRETAIAYAKTITAAWDRLTDVSSALGKIEAALIQVENDLAIDGHFETAELADEVGSRLKAEEAKQSAEVRIPVTWGMIRQNLLTFTSAMSPFGPFKLHQEVTLVFDGAPVRSRIISPGNRLQERSAVRRYYSDNKIRGGDVVLLKRVADDRWSVSVARGNDAGGAPSPFFE